MIRREDSSGRKEDIEEDDEDEDSRCEKKVVDAELKSLLNALIGCNCTINWGVSVVASGMSGDFDDDSANQDGTDDVIDGNKVNEGEEDEFVGNCVEIMCGCLSKAENDCDDCDDGVEMDFDNDPDGFKDDGGDGNKDDGNNDCNC